MTAKESERLLLVETARGFAARELAGRREGALARAYDLGFLSMLLPEELGGLGHEVTPLCLVLQSLAEADASLAGIVFTQALAQEILRAAGGEEALHRVFEGRATVREALIACPAYVNPGEIELRAEARPEGGAYRLYGQQDYLVLGGLATRVLIPAAVYDRPGYSFFLAEIGGPEALASPPILSLGLHGCPAADLRLEGLPASLVGREGEGPIYFDAAAGRLGAAVAAIAAGIMAGSLKEALEYAQERTQGGTEIIHWPEVRMILAQMAVDAKIAEMASTLASQAADQGQDGWRLCSRAAAIHATDLAPRLTADGIQVLGGVGYLEDFGQEGRYRDAQQVQALLGLAPMKKLDYLARAIALRSGA